MTAWTRLIIVVLVLVCAYNCWQLHTLQSEIGQLKANNVAVKHQIKALPAKSTTGAAGSWLDQANKHMANARSAMARSDFGTARAELGRGTDDLQHAVQQPENEGKATLNKARQTLAGLQSEADSMFRHVQPSGATKTR